ncbi:hypothetical protein SISSUDRAFT_1067945 [Sistotremastrum suecicum HHB10207 ss-3]|uniref:GED domain-containing protein n=1 Tax=Sistotremastrum suecicum HHB10207 ss-3 TaxID=1314776 RepID=A0A165WJJ6_9AGAM|nr:hypothetical protein SISSUDRAFT_1067945 [Sistotremastrum suecicum HHB10207 ss-3]
MSKFSTEVVAQVNSTLAAKDIYTQFKSGIMSTAPDFRPYLSSDPQIGINVFPIAQSAPSVNGPDNVQILYLDHLKDLRQKAAVNGLSNFQSHPIQLALINAFVGKWQRHILDCVEKIHLGVCAILNSVLSAHFNQYPELLCRIRMILYEDIERCKTGVLQKLASVPKMETVPFTQNTWQLSSLREQWLQHYVNERAERMVNPWICLIGDVVHDTRTQVMDQASTAPSDPILASNVLAGLQQLGYGDLTLADLRRLKVSDDYKEELELAADVRGYFDIASGRVIDFVPIIINHHYLSEFLDNLNFTLVKADIHHITPQ